jgi:putative transposase
MIAYLLLRLAAWASRCALPALRFAERVGQCLFIRKPIALIDKPPEVNPSRPKPKISPGQLEIAYG